MSDSATRFMRAPTATGSVLFQPSSCTCVFGPVLDVTRCPYYGPGCTVQFYRTAVGASMTTSIGLRNTGGVPLHVTAAHLAQGGPVAVSGPLPSTIGPQDSITLTLVYAPIASGLTVDKLVIESDAVVQVPKEVPVPAATPDTGCHSDEECLFGERCDLASASCHECPLITPPPCDGGSVVAQTGPDGCVRPACVCPPGTAHEPGMGCTAQTTPRP